MTIHAGLRWFVGLAIALPASLSVATAAHAVDFTVANDSTNYTITEIEAEDLQGNHVGYVEGKLSPGETADLAITGGYTGNQYNFRIHYTNLKTRVTGIKDCAGVTVSNSRFSISEDTVDRYCH